MFTPGRAPPRTVVDAGGDWFPAAAAAAAAAATAPAGTVGLPTVVLPGRGPGTDFDPDTSLTGPCLSNAGGTMAPSGGTILPGGGTPGDCAGGGTGGDAAAHMTVGEPLYLADCVCIIWACGNSGEAAGVRCVGHLGVGDVSGPRGVGET